MSDYQRLETQLVHAGELLPRIAGAVEMPIFQSATYEYGGEAGYDDVRYLRINNTPNHLALHAKMALENAEAALVTASGMAAIPGTLLALLEGRSPAGASVLYGGTHELRTREFPRWAWPPISSTYAARILEAAAPQTRAVYVETMTNPLLEVANLRSVVSFARQHGLIRSSTTPSRVRSISGRWRSGSICRSTAAPST